MSTPTDSSETDVPDAVTYRELQGIIRSFQGSDWRSMTLELRGLRISLGKDGPPAAPAPVGPAAAEAPSAPAATPAPTEPAPAAPPAAPAGSGVDTEGCVAVRSPAVGAFWVAPSPGEAPFVQAGQHVDEDQQLAIVEVMKLMNPVVSAVAGEVVEVCAANADLVEYDQVLFWVRPDRG
jgi:acetyl-CoA carboxylase biotin carboxyl carrier protein